MKLLLSCLLYSLVTGNTLLSQTSTNNLKIFDLTGKGYAYAVQTARVNSTQNAIFLLIASDDQSFTDFFIRIGQLEYAGGKERIYIILADKTSPTMKNECVLVANGDRIRTWAQEGPIVKDSEYYSQSAEILKIVRETYEQYIN